jgi:hypothetical protein
MKTFIEQRKGGSQPSGCLSQSWDQTMRLSAAAFDRAAIGAGKRDS